MKEKLVTVFILGWSLIMSPSWLSYADSKTNQPPILVKSEVSKSTLNIGDLVTYTVTIKHLPNVKVSSTVTPPAEDFFTIKKVEDLQGKEGAYQIEGRKYTLTTFQLGEFIIDPVEIEYREGNGAIQKIQTDQIYMTVKSVSEGEEKKDIRGVKPVMDISQNVFPYVVALLIFVLLGAGYLFYQSRQKKSFAPVEEKPKISPDEQALNDLDQLQESDFLRQGKIKEYHLRLSEILRVYFENRYNILAVESTTDEIARFLKDQGVDIKLREKIREVLEGADLAKFAKWKPEPSVIQTHFQKAKQIITESRLRTY